MTIYYSKGSQTSVLGMEDYVEAISTTLQQRPSVKKVLAVPPDHTRLDSQAGPIMHAVLQDMVNNACSDKSVAPYQLATGQKYSDAYKAFCKPDVSRGDDVQPRRLHELGWRFLSSVGECCCWRRAAAALAPPTPPPVYQHWVMLPDAPSGIFF